MATRTNKVEVEITATDEATPKIERLEKKIDGLESDEARITVTAQTDRLEKQLADAKQKLEGLDGDHATVQLRAIGNLEDELEQAQQLFQQLDGKTGTVRINAVDKATGDLRNVRQELSRLDGDTASIRTNVAGITGGVAGGIGLAGVGSLLFNAAQEAANLSLEVQQVAEFTGASLEDASRLTGVFRNSGVEASDLLDMISNVNGVLAQSPELAEKLGIKDSTDLIDTFIQAVDGIGTAYDNAGERGVASAQLFGEEGQRQVLAVRTAIDTDLASAFDQFSGPIVTDESVENARKVNNEMADAKASIQEISLMLLPAVTAALDGLAAYFNAVAAAGDATFDFFDRHPRLRTALFSTSPSDIGTAIFGGENTSSGPFPPGARGQGVFPQQVTIINPPGTPAATVDAARVYERRNGFGF